MPGSALATRGQQHQQQQQQFPSLSTSSSSSSSISMGPTDMVGCVTAVTATSSSMESMRSQRKPAGTTQQHVVDTARAVSCLPAVADTLHTKHHHRTNGSRTNSSASVRQEPASFSSATPEADATMISPDADTIKHQHKHQHAIRHHHKLQQHHGSIVRVASLDDITTEDEDSSDDEQQRQDARLSRSKGDITRSPLTAAPPCFVHEAWRGDKRVDDARVHAVLCSVPEVDVHARCRSHNDVRRALGDHAYRDVTRLLQPVFSASRKALVVTLFMDWQKRTSNRNMHQLYRRKHAFRQMRARRRGTDLAALARAHNVGVTELGMALVGGLFSKYFCLTPHRLDPTAERDKFEVLEDEDFLRWMARHRVRVALVLRARQRLCTAGEEQEEEEEEEETGEEVDGEEQTERTGLDSNSSTQRQSHSNPHQPQHQKQQQQGCPAPTPSTTTSQEPQEPLLEVTEEEWMRLVEEDDVLRAIALEGALCMDGMRYYSRTDSENRMFWFQQVVKHSRTDKISAFTYRDAQTKPRQATHAEQQLMRDLEAMGVPRERYLLEAEMKKTHETNVATPDVKFHHPVRINGRTVRWVDVKSGLAFPRTSCSRLLGDFARKLRKYVDLHGEGLVLMHHVPLSAGIEAWAAAALGPERTGKVAFLSRVRVNRKEGRRRAGNGMWSGASAKSRNNAGSMPSASTNSGNTRTCERVPLLPTPTVAHTGPLAVGLLDREMCVADESDSAATSCCSSRDSSPDRMVHLQQQRNGRRSAASSSRSASPSQCSSSAVYRAPYARSHQPSPTPTTTTTTTMCEQHEYPTRTTLSRFLKRAGSGPGHRRTRSSPLMEAYVPPHRRAQCQQ